MKTNKNESLGITNVNQILYDSRIGADMILFFGEKEELCHSLFLKIKFPNYKFNDKNQVLNVYQIIHHDLEQNIIDDIMKYIYDLVKFTDIISTKSLSFFEKMKYIQITKRGLILINHRKNKSKISQIENYYYKSNNDFFVEHDKFLPLHSLHYRYENYNNGKYYECIMLQFKIFLNTDLYKKINKLNIIEKNVSSDNIAFYDISMDNSYHLENLELIVLCLETFQNEFECDLNIHIIQSKKLLSRLNNIKQR